MNISNLSTEELLFHYDARSVLLHQRDGSIREYYANPSSPEYKKYIDTEAILYFRELQECAVPFPSSAEMSTVGGETDLRKFLAIGYECAEVIEKYAPESDAQIRILDFGVGCARTMRHFFRYHSRWDCYGCDVDKAAIQYIEESVPFITGLASNNLPPLPYENNYFGFIYIVSVFTHLDKKSFLAWIKELARVTEKDGTVLPSIHGTTALNNLKNDENHRRLIGIEESEFEKGLTEFERDGFVWMNQASGSSDIDSEQYGICFLDERHLDDFFGEEFQICSHTPGELGGWQDIVKLRKM